MPVVHEAIAAVGHRRRTRSGSSCSGSLDYLQGGPFAFVAGLDAVGAWPPMRESHVEMDAAWALYEAWVAIQTGEVDSALVYGFGKSSPGDLHEIMTLQTDPYYVAAAVAVDGRHGRAAGERVPRSERPRREAISPRSRPARSATRSGNPHAVRKGDVDRRRRARAAGHARSAARRRHRADHRRRRRGRDRGRRPRPLGVRATGVDPRHRAPHRGARPRRARPHDVGVDAARPRERGRRATTARSTSPSCTRSSATRS